MRPPSSALALAIAAVVAVVIAAPPAAAALFDPPQPAVYVVRAGDTLAEIADRFSTTPQRLVEVNSLSGRLISPGQVLRIPGSHGLQGQTRPGKTAPGLACNPETTIIVRPGDTLQRIASRCGVSMTALKEANGLVSNALMVGQALKIPSGPGPAGLDPAPASPSSTVTVGPAQSTVSSAGPAR